MLTLALWLHRRRNVITLCLAVLLAGLTLLYRLSGFGLSFQDTSTFDLAVTYRFTSPEPNPDIVILDIDEKSLATMAPDHGRWPWTRSILAEVIAELEAAGAQNILVNIIFSDAAKTDIDGDMLLAETIAESANVTLPVVRLPVESDSLSKLTSGVISDSRIQIAEGKTAALLLPWDRRMHKRLGISNLSADDDGKLRRYALRYSDNIVDAPTLVGRVRPRQEDTDDSSTLLLNWRNKTASHTRISFSDVYEILQAGELAKFENLFDGKHVVVTVSAPGLAKTHATPHSGTVDEGEILATALDDLVSGSSVQQLSVPFLLSIELSLLMASCALMLFWGQTALPDISILILDIGAVATVLLGVSFWSIFIDLTPAVLSCTALYGGVRLLNIADRIALQGNKTFLRATWDRGPYSIILLSVSGKGISVRNSAKAVSSIEALLGVGRVLWNSKPFANTCISSYVDTSMMMCVIDEAERHTITSIRQYVDAAFGDAYLCHTEEYLLENESENPTYEEFVSNLAQRYVGLLYKHTER